MTGSHVTAGAGAGEAVAGGQDRPRGEGHRRGKQGSDGSRARALGGHLADYPGSPSSSGLCCGSGRQSLALCTFTMSQGSASTSSPRPLSLLPWNKRKVALSSTSIGLWGLGAPRLADLARSCPALQPLRPGEGFWLPAHRQFPPGCLTLAHTPAVKVAVGGGAAWGRASRAGSARHRPRGPRRTLLPAGLPRTACGGDVFGQNLRSWK